MDISEIKKQQQSTLNYYVKQHDRIMAFIESNIQVFIALPPSNVVSVFPTWASIYYYPENNGDAEKLRSEVQKVLSISATREIGEKDGSINYVFNDKKFTIHILKYGTLSPNCRLVEKEKVVKIFESVCEESNS